MSFVVKAPLKLFKVFRPRRITKPIKLKRNDVRNLKFKRSKRHDTRDAVVARLFVHHRKQQPVFTDETPEEAEGPPCMDMGKDTCSNIRL